MTVLIGLDTSIAIPLLVRAHPDRSRLARSWHGREVALCGPAVTETYSVLTRLPGDLQVTPGEAAKLMAARFSPPLVLATKTMRRLPAILADLGISGGQVYDALVALTAIEHGVEPATRDGRARGIYEVVGARVVVGR
jgi:toxin FitB